MDKTNLILCGPDQPEIKRKDKYKKIVPLNTDSPNNNVNLRIENISTRLAQNLTSLVKDLVEIGSYVYCADQSVSRGGSTWRQDGKDWRRNLQFDIPVRNPDLWNGQAVKDSLIELLSFISDDHYDFSFRKLTKEIPDNVYFEFDEGKPWFDADEILLFSGGLDSLAGMIHEVIDNQKKVLLISHRPVAKISKRQVDLLQRFGDIQGKTDTHFHIPVWVNKDQELTKDTNQRTRSFLYASLAAGIAHLQGNNSIKFFENGIISINLPISPQLIGARASRSTHPKSLNLMSRFFTSLFDKEFNVTNPFIWKTKSDVVKIVNDSDFAELIGFSNSCSHIRTVGRIDDHCGVCSQCIDRKIAMLNNEVSDDHDPEFRYKVQLFTDPLEETEDRTMVESYVKHANSLEKLNHKDFIQKFGEIFQVIDYLPGQSSENTLKIIDLHKRHGMQVGKAIEKQIQAHSRLIRQKRLNPNSLLAMTIKQNGPKSGQELDMKEFPTPAGTKWEDIEIEIISNDSVRIKVKGITERYTAFDMGFRDHRKKDLPNAQWDTLLAFAESEGVLSWASPSKKNQNQKNIQALRKTLKQFFQLSDYPIRRYQKGIGYVARFKIKDCSFGKS